MRFEVKTETEFAEKIKEASDKLILAYFWAEWCRPCKILAPKLKDVELEYPELVVLKIEVDEAEDLSALFNVNMLPTFYLLKSNFIITDFSGSNMDKLKENVKKYYNADVSKLKEKVKPLASIYDGSNAKEKRVKGQKKVKEVGQVPLPEVSKSVKEESTLAEAKASDAGSSNTKGPERSRTPRRKKAKKPEKLSEV